MKIIKNVHFLLLFVSIFTIDIFTMDMADMTNTAAAKQYFMYEQGTDNGIWVKEKDVINNSKVLTSLIEDTGDTSEKIPLDFPLDTIKLAFNVLQGKIKHITKLSLEQIISVANLFNYLDVPTNKLLTVLAIIKKDIDTNKNYTSLNKLHPDLQKLLLTQPIISCLKDCIIEKYLNDRKTILVGHPLDVRAIAFHPSGKKFVSGSLGLAPTNLILWDITDPYNITHQALPGPQIDVVSVAFSHDGTKIAFGCSGNQNNLIISDISDTKNISQHVLDGHPMDVLAVAFSPDDKQLISGSAVDPDGAGNPNNLILWDITDLNAPVSQIVTGCPNTTVHAIAFHPTNNTQFALGCAGNENNLMICDISDINNVMYQTIEGCSSTVYSVAYNAQGTYIVSGSEGCSSELPAHSNLILRNINDLNNSKLLIGHPSTVQAATFNPTGTKIASGCREKKDNLIIWNIKDPNTITHQILNGHPEGVLAVEFSPDNKYMVSGGYGLKENLIFWTFLTDQEEQLLNDLRNYNADHIRLLYELCQKQSIGLEKDSDEYKIFESLPQDMQDLLNNLFIKNSENFGWLSNIWQMLIQRKM